MKKSLGLLVALFVLVNTAQAQWFSQVYRSGAKSFTSTYITGADTSSAVSHGYDTVTILGPSYDYRGFNLDLSFPASSVTTGGVGTTDTVAVKLVRFIHSKVIKIDSARDAIPFTMWVNKYADTLTSDSIGLIMHWQDSVKTTRTVPYIITYRLEAR